MDKVSYKNRLVGLTADQQRYVGLDCEMVGVAPSPDSTYPTKSILAQVSIVDWNGYVIYQSYVTPTEPVIDYRTPWSGITKELLEKQGRPFAIVKAEVLNQIANKIVVGHALENDFAVLEIDPSTIETRDTGYAPEFKKKLRDGSFGSRKLKELAEEYLGKKIQTGQHDPAEDARTAMELFKKFRYEIFEPIVLSQANINAFVRAMEAMAIKHTNANTNTELSKNGGSRKAGKATKTAKATKAHKAHKNGKSRKAHKAAKAHKDAKARTIPK
jgi:DNA polymerase III epsilon subunit-like protein